MLESDRHFDWQNFYLLIFNEIYLDFSKEPWGSEKMLLFWVQGGLKSPKVTNCHFWPEKAISSVRNESVIPF